MYESPTHVKNYADRLKVHLHIIRSLLDFRGPIQDALHIFLQNMEIITIAHGRLQEHTNGIGQLIYRQN